MTSAAARLAGLAEVAVLGGRSRKRAWQLTQHADFPAPLQVLAMGPVWLETEVAASTVITTGRQPHTRCARGTVTDW
jgi:predicted DNA-binding transcriptional regulator AlpA